MNQRIMKLDKTRDMGVILDLGLVWSEFEHYKDIFCNHENFL